MESAQKVWNGNGAHARDVIHNYFISKLWFSHCKSGDILLFFFCWLLTPTQTRIVVSFILKSCFSNATVQAGQAFANRVVLVADPTPAGEMLSWSVFLWLGGISHGQLKRIKATILPTKWVGTTSSGKKKKINCWDNSRSVLYFYLYIFEHDKVSSNWADWAAHH